MRCGRRRSQRIAADRPYARRSSYVNRAIAANNPNYLFSRVKRERPFLADLDKGKQTCIGPYSTSQT